MDLLTSGLVNDTYELFTGVSVILRVVEKVGIKVVRLNRSEVPANESLKFTRTTRELTVTSFSCKKDPDTDSVATDEILCMWLKEEPVEEMLTAATVTGDEEFAIVLVFSRIEVTNGVGTIEAPIGVFILLAPRDDLLLKNSPNEDSVVMDVILLNCLVTETFRDAGKYPMRLADR